MTRSFALFFTTQGKSLANWNRLGMLEREIKLYQHTADQFDRMYFFTYGLDDKKYQALLPNNVIVVPRPAFVPIMIYSFLLPFFHWRILKNIALLKTNQMDGSWTAVIAKKLFGGKLIVRCGYEWLQFIERSRRGWIKRRFAQWAEKFSYQAADVIIHTSHEAATFAIERFSISKRKIMIIPNYINTNLFAPRPVKKEKGSIVFVGRLEPQKNLSMLIDALTDLPVTLTVIGRGSERVALEQFAKERHISVQWKETVDQRDLPQELLRHEVFILPSLYEGSPKTLLEAMACGLPCIATDVSGNREVIHHGENGFLCDTSAKAIKGAIQTLLADEIARQKLGENARNTILKTYSFEKVFEQELSVYTALQ